MTGSTSSQQRAQLIREMSKDMNRTRDSSRSSRLSLDLASPQPTVSDFDPENEAIMSTRQLDNNAQQLPEIRPSAQKYSRFTGPEPDFAINTSAIGRAFPDFSQGGSSSDDDSRSIEIGRGLKKGRNSKAGRLNEYSSNAQLSLDGDSMDFSAPMIGNYEVTGTPPLSQRQSSKKTDEAARGSLRRDTHVRRPSNLQKEITGPSPPPSKTRDYGSGESRKGSGENRRTLSSMHARVRDENERSRLSEERPPTLDLTARNTRFGNVKGQHIASDGVMPTKFTSKQGLLQSLAPTNRQKSQTVATPQGTQQSFMLPDLPNISELVSGIYEDGTPVFSRHGKSRASRFVSASGQIRKGQDYVGVNEIPVPADEQAIFLSLKLLQDKVATLEKTNVEAENAIQDLQQKNRVLEAEKNDMRRVQRSDSALGTTDSDVGNEVGGSQRKLLIEKSRLESSVRALQSQLDNSNRKASTAETILKNITQERDSAISQLGVAYFTIEQLKAENEGLKGENNELKSRLAQSSNGHEKETKKWTAKEEALRRKLDRRTEAVQSAIEETGVQRPELEDKTVHKARHAEGTERNIESSSHKDVNTMFDLRLSRKDVGELSKGGQRTVLIDDSQDTEDSEYEAPNGKGKGQARSSRSAKNAHDDEASQNLTYLSFLESDEIARLRKTLEQERIQRKQRRNRDHQPDDKNDTVTQTSSPETQAKQPQQIFPRKSSMKTLISRSTNRNDATERSLLPGAQPEQNRRHSETSILSIRSRRRGLDAENMTSAFIVPDITIRNPGVDPEPIPELTKEAQDVLTGLAKHDGQHCTVCKRVIRHDEHHEHRASASEAIKIPKPVPVSERMPKPSPNEEDPTIRPAQAPGLALAVVMKGLEDELTHLKIELAQYQALHNGHDPALSKRKRKSVYQKIEILLKAIEVKADQVYALYDVLEGQKQDGREMSEEEVEITLQSVGIIAAGLHLRGGGVDEEQDNEKENPSERQPWDLDSDGESGDDLPWEGIETTAETAKSGFTGRRSSDA
ncbi:MAG: hypothetical protein ALECFALPRED_006584 [Alectoria fallacina]|uniref:Cep57 centrosome microtubule-binding domain-containing protein n=1 Tax=Alectoria fallacina TaxID=1903189 RepID=A0A8H3I7L9_9LECA|nr:MAG: hypothetical protein ALECFALPRED_006584 [Alectoria fallacina]